MTVSRGSRTKAVLAVVLGVVLAALMVYPWPQGESEPIVLGIIPAPLLLWIIWTALFIAYVGWIAYRWDPYTAVVRRAAADTAATAGEVER